MSTHQMACSRGDQHRPSPSVARTSPTTRGADSTRGIDAMASMRVARDAGAAGADQEVEVGTQVRLLHVVDVDLLPAALGLRQRLPGRETACHLLVADLHLEAAGVHVELDHVAVLDDG